MKVLQFFFEKKKESNFDVEEKKRELSSAALQIKFWTKNIMIDVTCIEMKIVEKNCL